MKKQLKATIWNMFRFSGKILFLTSFLLLFQTLLSCHPQNQTAGVDVREEQITIATQVIKASPYPAFPVIATAHWKTNDIYPYSWLSSPTTEKVDKEYKLLILENEFLKITVLPEVGGHIYSFYDKVNDRETIYTRPLIKPTSGGHRGGWFPIGLEFNFPHAHYASSCETVDYSIRKNTDGSGSIFVGEVENRYGMKWQVELKLQPGKAFLEQRVKLHNPTPLPHRYHFWNIVAFPNKGEVQVVFPTRRTIGTYHESVYSYPIWAGQDISWDKNRIVGGDWAGLDNWDDFWCLYQHDEDAGLAHITDRRIFPGSKCWSPGPGVDYDYKLLSMGNEISRYLEIDSGSDLTQAGFRRMQALASHDWVEYWSPVKGLKGEIVKVNRDAALSLVRDQNRFEIALNTTSEVKKGLLTVSVDEEILLNEEVSILPLKPFLKEIGKIDGIISVNLKDGNGKEILAYIDNPIDESNLHPLGATVRGNKQLSTGNEEYVNIKPDAWWTMRGKKIEEMSAEELYLGGKHQLRHNREHFNEAEELFKASLKKDPGYSRSHTELGIMKIKKGLWKEAEAEFKASIFRNPTQGAPFFYRGFVRKMNGNTQGAIDDLYQAVKYPDTYAQAYFMLGQIALANGELDKAIGLLDKSHKVSNSIHVLTLSAAAYRKMGKYKLSEAALESVLAEDPINYFAAYEQYCVTRDMDQIGKERQYEEFVKLISDKDQNYLELAGIYINSGIYQESIDLLEKFIVLRKNGREEKTVGRRPERYLQEPDHVSPMFYYYLGYSYGKIGQAKKSEEYYRIPMTIENWNLVFPNRLNEFFILEEAIKKVPEDYLANYALGNILAGRYRFSDAITQWKTALEKMNSLSDEDKMKRSDVLKVIYVNIGSVLWKIENKPDEAIPYLEKSIEYAGWHFQPYHDLASLYMEEKEINRAIKVAESGVNKVQDGWFLARDILVPLYYKQQNYDRIIELLHNHWGGHIFRATFQDHYRQAHLAKGKKLFREREFEDALKVFDRGMVYPEILLLNENDEGSQAFAELFWWKGLTFNELGKNDEALMAWENAAVNRYSTYARGNIFKAKSLMRLGKKSEAKKLMDEILFACEERSQIITEYSSGPWFAYLDYLQAEVYEEMGDIRKAKEFYRKAIIEDPDHTEPVYSDVTEKLKEIEKKERK